MFLTHWKTTDISIRMPLQATSSEHAAPHIFFKNLFLVTRQQKAKVTKTYLASEIVFIHSYF